jgi:hypothetical protein
MEGFPWMFWLVPILFFVVLKRHRWDRWSEAPTGRAPRLQDELEAERSYVDGLERRVAELEERLDFTERLLATRQDAPVER